MNKSRNILIIVLSVFVIGVVGLLIFNYFYKQSHDFVYVINVSNLTYSNKKMKTYSQSDFDTFLSDYKSKTLPEVYVTEFLFDGVSMYKPLDYDDFVKEGNNLKVEPLKITNININTTKKLEFTGNLKGGMVSINTNHLDADLNITLNDLKIDTDSKKVPVVYAYNKDITYTDHKVTISTKKNTHNYLDGGKLKKISLIPSEDLNNYSDNYSANISYSNYTNYYGVYSSSDIDNILFAKVKANEEDLKDGDPYYFYKASGAISSDIDLYFEGEGYLEVNSKNDEGIETKGNLTFSGASGDYVVNAYDDCLNTTTDKSDNENARNTITINVNSLTAIVSLDAKEGDAIDSNGELILNGGKIIAISFPGSDSGLDSEDGIYINAGAVISTGDMLDSISPNSKQKFIALSFSVKPEENDIVTLLNKDNKNVFAFKTDRSYSNLIYSSGNLDIGNYTLYKNGEIDGEETNGFYTKINSYNLGVQLAYSSLGDKNGGMPEDRNGNPPEKPEGEPPEKPDDNEDISRGNNQNIIATNKTFTITDLSTYFNGIAPYAEL
ncbi:MAG: carbohydrate-binding domain-containing protein [Bacilli bacterium]|nr:carbohydrate-binding domain-containing protein [Bacilli bacterium]